MSPISKRIMQQVIDKAAESAKSGGGPFAAAIVKDGVLLSMCSNSVSNDNDPTAHAEVNAIRKACLELADFDLSACEIYTSCEPCPMCLGAIYWARLKSVCYAADRADAANSGFDDDLIYKEVSIDPSARKIPFVQVLQAEGRKPFETWNSNPDKIDY